MGNEKNYYINIDSEIKKIKQFIKEANIEIENFEKNLQEIKLKRKESEENNVQEDERNS